MGLRSSPALVWSLRVFSSISLLIGIGFIAWAIILQNPPKSALPVGLLIMGIFGMGLGVMGFFLSLCGRCCINVYLLFSFFVTVGQLAIIITCFTNLDGSVENLTNYVMSSAKEKDEPKPDRKLVASSIQGDIEVARYVFLVAVLLELFALLSLVVIRFKFPHEEDPDSVEEQASAKSAMAQIQLESLKHSLSRSKQATSPAPDSNVYTASNKMNKSVTRKMTQKYGEFTQDPTYQKKWWQKVPGLG